ncbi:MAG: rhomboid family intramembrane serine protease [Myxococcales bacterium]|nr:rhomboid family intramembrane serine protease [Myxococcales bacterium]
MFLPIGDEPNPKPFTPWVTWALIAANVLVYLMWTLPLSFAPPRADDPILQEYLTFLGTVVPAEHLELYVTVLTSWDLAVFEHGYRPSNPSVVDLFTSMFMHAGFAHLAGNMLFLWIYGDNVEHRMGRLGFLAMYLATGVVATLSFALLAGSSGTPLVGASGAISGVLGVYALLFPRNVVKVVIFFFPFFVNTVLLPAWLVLGGYVVVQNLLPLFLGGDTGVAYGAHLGGFFAGALVGLVLGPGIRMSRMRGAKVADLIAQAEHLADRGSATRAVHLLAGAARGADSLDQAKMQLAAGMILAREGRRVEAFQWLSKAARHPSTASEARMALQALSLDPRLQRRYDA